MIASWGWCGGDALPSVGSALPQQLLYRETFSRSTLLLLALSSMLCDLSDSPQKKPQKRRRRGMK